MKGIRHGQVVTLAACTAVLAWSGVANAVPLFSLTGGPSGSDSTIWAPGPIGGPPTPFIVEAGLGIAVPGTVDLDAMSFGAPADTLYFSVDPFSVGIPGVPHDVFSESAVGQVPADIFSTSLAGTNSLFINQDLLGLLAAIPPGVPGFPPLDNVDALDLEQFGPVPGPGPVLFSLITGNVFGLSAASILGPTAGAGPPVIVFVSADLGLIFADDVDAYHYDTTTGFGYFSLAPGSPSLGAAACGGTSAADIFITDHVGSCALFAPAITLGLLSTDNVDAIAFVGIPEPSTVLLVGLGLVGLAARKRRLA